MKNLTTRALTATVFVAILLGCTYYSHFSFAVLFFGVTAIGLWELFSLFEQNNLHPQKVYGIIAGLLIYFSNVFVAMDILSPKFNYIKYPLLALIFIFELFRKKENPFTNISVTVIGVIYVVLPFALLNHLVRLGNTYNYEILFGIFFILWCNDAGAYLVGSAIGKHKLFPRISPGKSWEGSIGGAIISYFIVYIISGWYTSISLFDWIIIATLLIVFGTLGDLVESLLKRSVGVKDSGNLLPGHGGILDRFDSLMMATPFIFFYLEMIK